MRRALRDGDLYDSRRRVVLDLDEIAHPADVAARLAAIQPWPAWYEDLAGLGRIWRPRTVLSVGVGLGYAAYCLCSGSLLGGVRRLRLMGVDPEVDTGPPSFGYRTLAMAAETFRRYLPEVRVAFHHWSTPGALPPEMIAERFQLVHVDGASSPADTLADLRAAWGVLVPGGLLVASRIWEPSRSKATADFLSWLVTEDVSFTSQYVHNDVGMALFRRDGE